MIPGPRHHRRSGPAPVNAIGVTAWLTALALILTACGGGSESDDAPRPDAAASVARIAGTACLRPIIASAVVIDDGLVLTVAHVVAGAEDDLRIITPRGREHDVTVVGFDPARDLALLAAESLEAPPLPLGRAEVDAEGNIVAVGGDLDVELISYRVRRRINARSGDIYDEGAVERAALDLDADVVPGVSGAAVIGQEGAVVGIVFAESVEQEAVTYALDTTEIEAFLAAVDPATEVDRGRCR